MQHHRDNLVAAFCEVPCPAGKLFLRANLKQPFELLLQFQPLAQCGSYIFTSAHPHSPET